MSTPHPPRWRLLRLLFMLALAAAACGQTTPPTAAGTASNASPSITNHSADNPQSFWETGRFIAGAVLILVGGLLGGYGWRGRRVEAHRRKLEAQVSDRTRHLVALQEINRALVSTLELDALLKTIIQQAATLLKADGGILNLADWDKMEDEVVAQVGAIPNFLGERAPLEGGLSGWVTLHQQPVISNRLRQDPRVDPEALARFSGVALQNAAVAPLMVKERAMGTLVLIDKLGGNGEFSQADLDLLSSFANQAATAIENARLFAQEQRRAEQFRVIAEVGRRLALTPDINELLRQVVELIQEAFDYYHVGIGLIEGDEVVYRVGAGNLWDDPQFEFKPAHLKVGAEGLTGWVAGRGEPLLVQDVSQDPRYVWMQGSRTRSELLIPIIVKNQTVGVLDVQSDRLNAFDDKDVNVLQSLAHQAGAAIENARLYEQARQLAVAEERNRLARDLHDSVTQSLYGITLYAQAAAGHLAAGRMDKVAEHLRELQDTSQDALAEMRLLIFELRPPILAHDGLAAALQARLLAVEGRAGLKTEFKSEVQGRLPLAIEEGLYRIAQEALNNCLKHARARRLAVTVRREDSKVMLTIADDGVGFDPATAHERGGLGLSAMRERAAQLGARLSVTSQPGGGTQVSVEANA